jgi:hypothetical protein
MEMGSDTFPPAKATARNFRSPLFFPANRAILHFAMPLRPLSERAFDWFDFFDFWLGKPNDIKGL